MSSPNFTFDNKSSAQRSQGDTRFDLWRKRREPTWGDPTHREIPKTAGQDDVEYTHMHIQTSYLRGDRNVAWPVDIFFDYSMREHDQILDAFLKRNSQLAEKIVAKHLENLNKAIKEMLEPADDVREMGLTENE